MTSVMAGFEKLLLLVLFLLLSVNLTVGSPIQTQVHSARNPNAGGMVCDRTHRNGTTGNYDPYLKCRSAPRNYLCDIHGELRYHKHDDLCSKQCHCPPLRNHTTTAAFLDIAADTTFESGKNVIDFESTTDSIVKAEADNIIPVGNSDGASEIDVQKREQFKDLQTRNPSTEHATGTLISEQTKTLEGELGGILPCTANRNGESAYIAGNNHKADDRITAGDESEVASSTKRSVDSQHPESEFPGTIARDVTALRLMCKDPTPHNRYLELPCASKFDYTCMYTQDSGLPTYGIYNQTCSETCRCLWRLARDLDGRGV